MAVTRSMLHGTWVTFNGLLQTTTQGGGVEVWFIVKVAVNEHDNGAPLPCRRSPHTLTPDFHRGRTRRGSNQQRWPWRSHSAARPRWTSGVRWVEMAGWTCAHWLLDLQQVCSPTQPHSPTAKHLFGIKWMFYIYIQYIWYDTIVLHCQSKSEMCLASHQLYLQTSQTRHQDRTSKTGHQDRTLK